MYQQLSDAVRTASAIQFHTKLQSVDAGVDLGEGRVQPSYVAPAKFKDGPLVSVYNDGTVVDVTTVLNSTAANANRFETALDDFFRLDTSPSFPFVDIRIDDQLRLNGLQLPHRNTDSYYRNVEEAGYIAETSVMRKGQERYEDDLTKVLERFPTALLFGSWAAHTNTLARSPRIISSQIDGITRLPASSFNGAQRLRESALEHIGLYAAAMRQDPYLGGKATVYKAIGGGITLNKAEMDKLAQEKQEEINKQEDLKAKGAGKPKKDANSLASHGLGNILSVAAISKVRIDFAVENTVVSLAALRGFHFPDHGTIIPERDHAARTYLAALGILAFELARARGYFLRSECSLVPMHSTFRVVGDDDAPFAWDDIPRRDRVAAATTLYVEAVAEMQKHGLTLAEPRELQATPALRDLLGANAKVKLSADADTAEIL